MEKMKKSVKIVLISVVSALLVFGIVLGCVLGGRSNPNNPNNPNLNSPEAPSIINSDVLNNISLSLSNQNNIISDDLKIYSASPYANYCNDNRILKSFNSNSFIIRDSESSLDEFYIYNYDPNTSRFEIKELTASIDNGGFVRNDAISYRINAYNEKYVVLVSEYNTTIGSYYRNSIYSLINIMDFEEPKEIFTFETRNKNIEIFDLFNLQDNYFSFTVAKELNVDTMEYKIDMYYYALNDGEIIEESQNVIENINFDNNYDTKIYSDSFIVKDNNSYYIVKLNNLKFSIYSKNVEDTKIFALSKIANNKYLLEKKKYFLESKIVNISDFSINEDGTYYEYEYLIIDISGNSLTENEYLLDNGYAKLTSDTSLDNYFYLIEQAIENHVLQNKYIIKLYNENFDLLVSYSSELKDDFILYCKENYIVTRTKIYTVNSNTLKIVYDFEENNFILYSNKINSDYFIVTSDYYYGIMDYKANIIINPNEQIFTNIYNFEKSNVTIGYNGGYSLIDLSSGEISSIENYFEDENFNNLISNGSGIYLVQEENGTLSIKSFLNENLYINIDTYKFISINKGALLELYNSNGELIEILNYETDENFSVVETEEDLGYFENESDVVSTFGSKDTCTLYDRNGTTKIGTIYVYHDSGSAGWHTDRCRIEMEPGYRLSNFSFDIRYSGTYTFKITSTSPTSASVSDVDGSGEVSGLTTDLSYYNNELRVVYTFTDSGYYWSEVDLPSGSYNLTTSQYKTFTRMAYFYNRSSYPNGRWNSYYSYSKNLGVSKTVSYTLPSGSITGATVSSWYTSKSGGSSIGTAGSNITYTFSYNTLSYNYYARYTANTYKVTLNKSEGSNGTDYIYYKYKTSIYYSKDSCTSNDRFNIVNSDYYINIPNRTGYYFYGYYTDKLGQGICYIDKDGKITNSLCNNAYDDTLYAYWIAYSYNVEFVIVDENNSAFFMDSSKNISYNSLKQIDGETPLIVNTSLSWDRNNLNNSRKSLDVVYSQLEPTLLMSSLPGLVNEKYFILNNIYIEDSSYKLIGWVLGGTSISNESNKSFYYTLNSSSVLNATLSKSHTLSDYLSNFEIPYKPGSEEINDKVVDSTIYLYALYEVRSYSIGVSVEESNGSTTEVKKDDEFEVNVGSITQNKNNANQSILNIENLAAIYTVDVNYTAVNQYLTGGTTLSKSFIESSKAGGTLTTALGGEVRFTISVLDTSNESSYSLKTIELTNFPYKSSSTPKYSLKTITITIKENSDGTVTYDINGATLYNGYYYASSIDTTHNRISISGLEHDKITITIENLSYPIGTIGDSTSISGSDTILNYTGTTGFNISITSRPVEETTDNYSFNGDLDSFSKVIPNGGYIAVPATYANGKVSFWLDGVKKEASVNELDNTPTIDKNTIPGATIYYEKCYDLDGTKKYMAYIAFDYDNSKQIYKINDSVRVNYANSEIFFFEPSQSIIYYVNDNKVAEQGGLNTSQFYEPNSYLSTLQIGDSSFDLGLTKTFKDNSYNYNDYPTITGLSNKINNISSIFVNNYNYNGMSYKIVEGYDLTQSDNGSRYYLFLGFCEDNHKLLYILIGEGASNNNANITITNNIIFTFKEFNNSLNINISNSISGDNYGETDNGASVTFIAGANNGNIINSLPNNILPSSTIVIRISPNDGYLINSISLQVGDRKLMNLSLARGFDAFYSDSEKNISFVNKNLIGQENTQDATTINYTGEISSLTAFTNSNQYGIFYADHADDTFETTTHFESIYILISGIYQNVTVDVKTISYFELDFDVGESDISSKNDFKDKLSIASVSGDTYTSISSSDNIIYEVLSSGGTVIYRVKFFGLASSFKDGIAFFLSGEDYSYTFSNAKYYYGSTEDPFEYDFNRVTSVANSTGSIYINGKENTECLLFEVNSANKNINLKEFFSKSICWSESKINSGNSSDTGNSSDKGYIFNRKYTLLFTVKNHKTNMNTGSWLYVPNDTQQNINQPNLKDESYQSDNPYTKVDTWFNDTVVTNIDYYLNGSGTASKNWQQFFTNGDGTDTETSLGSISSISGYGIKIRYYQIPGYYLEKIGISNSQTGDKEVFIDISKYVSGSSNESTSIYYKFNYAYNDSTGTYIDIYLYISGNDFDSNAKSLRLLADSGFTINLYSRQYSIDVTLDADVNHDNISSKGTLTTNNKLTLTYDRIATIDATFSMNGYTFVGWSSYSGYNFDTNAGNIWSSVSRWTDLKNYFQKSQRDNLLGSSSSTISDRAFMVANGFFITDTGFASNSSERNGIAQSPQNYNFWSAFINYFNVYTYSTETNAISDSDFEYRLTLYGIWKANTYYVQLNLNDVNSGNGSTDAQAKMNGGSTFDSIGKGEILPGELTYGNKTYYLYVVFDTNNWYMLADSNFSIYSNNALSIGDFFNASNNYFIDFKSFIIDRYGYTWLGWFSEQIENAFEPSEYSYYKNNENYPTIADLIDSKNTDDKVITSTSAYGSSKDFTVFNYTLYSKNLSGNVSEISTNHFNYSGEQNALKNYKNKIIESYNEKCQNTDIYFYIYSSSGSKTKDYLNSNNLDVTYFDTVFNYDYYIKTTDSQGNITYKFEYKLDLTGDVYKSTYRYLTLYAYWETNLYTVEVNYMDSESANSVAGVMGSTSVSKSNNKFLPAYFDDVEFAERLKTFLPVRIGYDFVGWTFYPTITYKTEDDNQVVDTITYSAIDNSNLALYLNSDFRNYLFVQNTKEVMNIGSSVNSYLTYLFNGTDAREKLGDEESYHYVYLFAVWNVQTFTINISLNIDGSDLLNLYDFDSEFALGLYNSSSNDKIPVSYLKENGLTANTLDKIAENTFTNIVANIEFVINFDEPFSSARLYIGSRATNYTLSDLFATSLGYYFTGWFADPSTQIKIVENTTNSTFDSNGNIVSGLTNTLTGTHTINNYKFDLDMYNDLFVQTHENSVSNDKQYLNYVDYNGAQIHYTEEDDYFTTIGSSTNKSTNFGYVTGTDYYISVEKVQSGYTMYYVDSAGKKTEIVPYIVEKNSGFDTSYSAKFIANLINANDTGGTARFTFDENSFYFDGYTVKFDSISSDEEQNAYYVSTNYGEMTKIIIRFAVKGTNSDLNLNNITGLEQCNVTLTKTRQFTLYAGWEIKDDLNINISNGNIGSGVDPETYGFELGDDQSVDAGQTSNANYGLAGFYFIKGTGENNNSLSISQNESNIDLGFTFYDDIQLFIAPYFNGRFLSEISFEFYAYEQQSDNTIKKVTYVFTLNFDWDSTNHNIRCSSIRITRDNVNLAINGDIINYGNANVTNVYSSDSSNNGAIRNDLAVSGIPILSLLDQTAFDRNGQSKLFEISSYISDLLNYSRAFSGSGLINDRTEEMNGRTDVNYINIRLNALMTSVKIDCKFAVQTYNLEVYNVFDPLGNTLETLSDATYSKVAYSNLNDFAANSKSALSPSGSFTYGGVAESVSTSTYSFSSEQRVATIPTNVSSTSVSSTTYSVPYGYYIYGQYKSANDRPVDVAYDKDKNSGYNTSEYTGYGYIYEVGIYNYGGTSNAITNNKIDTHSDQCSPILGSKTLFAKSVRESSSLYTFVSWYIPILDEENGFILTEYNQQREETRIAENIILFGYYYANNKPTSLQFYTWNDTTNSYEQYKNNIDEYTLQSNTNSYRFDNTNTELEINGTFSSEDEILGTYITDDKRIILFENESFGVDVASFGVGSSIYTMAEISNNDTNKSFLENNVIRNYWFYRYYYTYVNVFAKVDGATVSRAVRYDIYGETTTGQLNGTSTTTEARLHFYYLIDENGEDIQTNRRYIQLFSDNLKDDSFIIYVNDVSQTGNIIVLSDYVTLNSIKNDPTLNIETATVMQEYSYYLTGSNMYAYVPVGGSSTEIDKYYLINKIEDYASDSNLTDEEKALLSTFYQYDEVANKHIYSDLTARFYAKIQGELYFLLATTSSESYNATTWYKYQPTGFESDGTKYNISNYEINFNQTNYTVKPIENYLDDELTADQRNILELHYDGSNYLTDARYYFFINDKTAYFLFDTLDSNGNGSLVNIYTYSLAGFITTNSYSIVNLDNYFMKVEDDYYAVEFTQRYDSDGSLYYNPYETNNTCVFNGTTYYFNYSNKLFYLDSSFENRLSTNSLSHTVYTPVNKNYVVKLSLPENPKDTDAWEYLGVNINSLPSPNIGFWYNNNSYGYVGYIDFKQSDISYMSSTVVSTEFSYERDNEGNIIKERMYDVFEKYINTVFASKDLTFREELLDAVKKKCEAYTFDDLQKTLITVDKFFTTDNTNSVYQVDLIIPVTFDLTISSGETYSITVSIKYRTSIITSSTTIEETIYAIPIYSRNVMEYTDESVKVSNDTVIEITPDDMYVVYFENVGNIDTRYYNADDGNYLEFAILNEMQYGMLTSSLNYPDELTYLLNKYAPTILYQCDNGSTVVNKTVSYDFGSLENGTYYVVAYYKKMDNYNYVIRSSDNVIKVVVSGSDGNKQVEYTLI